MTQVTLLMPFDTGHSYTMPPDLRWDEVLTTDERGSGWTPAYPPSHIQQPLGEPVWLRITPTEQLRAAEVAAGWLRHDFELQVIFFPIGIGILFLRGRLVGQGGARWSSLPAWEPEAYARFAPVALRASEEFAKLAMRVGLRRRSQVERKVSAPEFPWIYPLFFLDPAMVSADDPEVLASTSLDGAPISIRWKGTDVRLVPSADRLELEWYYLVASVTWQGLFIIDGLLSRLLAQLDHPSPRSTAQQPNRIDELRQVRLFCKRVVDGSRPLRWTIARGGVELLEGIHSAWTTAQMWQSIDDKTSLLVLSHEQQEAEARPRTPLPRAPGSSRARPWHSGAAEAGPTDRVRLPPCGRRSRRGHPNPRAGRDRGTGARPGANS
jgi:hypothetical protein